MKPNFNKKKLNFQGGPKGLIFIAIFFVVGLFALTQITKMSRKVTSIPYSQFLEKVEKGEVKNVKISDQFLVGRYKDGSRFETVISKWDPKFWDILRSHDVVSE